MEGRTEPKALEEAWERLGAKANCFNVKGRPEVKCRDGNGRNEPGKERASSEKVSFRYGVTPRRCFFARPKGALRLSARLIPKRQRESALNGAYRRV